MMSEFVTGAFQTQKNFVSCAQIMGHTMEARWGNFDHGKNNGHWK